MKWKELTRTGEAPKQGWMLAYLRKKVLFERYSSLEEARERIKQEELLELHLFNKEKEYRCIASGSKRYPSGVIETVADFKEDQEMTCSETIYLETQYRKLGNTIRLLNHLQYENGMLEVDNYRLIMEED